MTEKNVRKVFSRIGFSLLTVLLLGSLLQIVAVGIVQMIPGGIAWYSESTLGMMIITFAPLYLIAFPLGILMMKRLPCDEREKGKLGIKTMAAYGLMCLPIMYLGNTIGTLLSMILSGGTATNGIENLLTGNIFVEMVFLVILAPLFEEFLFRKMIIDRTVCHGEMTAVLFSALTFGMFHGNLFQFFYTFGVSFIWAYAYVKTRKLIYPFILHAAFNFIGGIVPSMLIKYIGVDNISALEAMELNETNQGVIAIYGVYTIAIILLAAAGCILLVRNRKQFVFEKSKMKIMKRRLTETEYVEEVKIGFKTVWMNPGMCLFSVVIFITFIVMLLA